MSSTLEVAMATKKLASQSHAGDAPNDTDLKLGASEPLTTTTQGLMN